MNDLYEPGTIVYAVLTEDRLRPGKMPSVLSNTKGMYCGPAHYGTHRFVDTWGDTYLLPRENLYLDRKDADSALHVVSTLPSKGLTPYAMSEALKAFKKKLEVDAA